MDTDHISSLDSVCINRSTTEVDAVFLLHLTRWRRILMCPITDDIYFDLIKVVSARILPCKITPFPFLLNKYFVAG